MVTVYLNFWVVSTLKKRIGQVFSLALAVVLVIAMAIPAHADVSDAAGYVVGQFWDMMTGKEYDMYFDYWKNFVGYLAGEECPSSPDKYHHGNVPVGGIGVFGSGGTDDNGKFVWHTCDYCGEQFKVYASDLQQSYDAQVEELPATGYTSTGSLIWQMPVSAVTSFRYDFTRPFLPVSELPYSGHGGKVFVDSFCSFKCEHAAITVHPASGTEFLCTYIVPFTGRMRRVSSTASRITFVHDPTNVSQTVADTYEISSFSFVSSGDEKTFSYAYDFSKHGFNESQYSRSFTQLVLYLPVFEVILDTAPSGDIYNINSRPTSITGDYGIIGDNGQITKVEGNTIVNETNNTVYNPVTGETKTMSDWSYNYEDRSYTVTTETGDTVTITYGDENVVIKEGDTTYNVYYLVDGSGSETPGVCNHQWTETATTPSTCTVPGSRTLTCSLCNEVKTETIPAPGHTWTIKQEVKTEYDEEGNKTQDGYTIFECSVCGEQYKSTDGGAPPGGGSGTGSGSSGGVFSGIFGLLVDFLGFFWNTFRDFVGEGVKGFLTALMDGTSSIFGLLNPFDWGG